MSRWTGMERLTDGTFDGIRFFVDDPIPPDHKCGGCIFRVRAKDGYTCSVVDTKIDLQKGTCMLWAKGIECLDKPNESRISAQTAGYVETDVVNCGSCRHWENGVCRLWNGLADRGQCCMVWEDKDLAQK